MICLNNQKTEHNLDNRGWLTHGWQKEMEGAVQETLPQGRQKPVAGLQPVSRQRMETILPSEKEEGSSVETKTTEHILTSLKAVSCLPKPVKSRKENANGSKTQEIKDWSDNGLSSVLQANKYTKEG